MADILLLQPPDRLTLIIARNVKRKMADNNVTQAVLGEHLGIAQPTVSKLLKGKLVFDADKLETIARLFNTSAEELVSRDGGPTGPDGGARVTHGYPHLLALAG